MYNQAFMQEEAILKEAIRAFSTATGAQITILGNQVLVAKNVRIDAVIHLAFKSEHYQLNVEVKGELRQTGLSRILTQFGNEKDKWLLVSKYIPGPLKEKLRKNGINYLEATGNCFININKIYLYINDREVRQVRKTPEGRLWKATGLKLLFLFIQDPNLIRATYRELSSLADIALGNISPLLDELRQEGNIQKDQATGKEVLINRDRLMTRWIELYPVVLRPKLLIGAFRFLNIPPIAALKNLQDEGVYWSGEPAGELYTHNLIPEAFTLYTTRRPTELIKILKIVPDEKGNVMMFQKFWHDWPGSASIQGVVPPLLAYADLINDSDSRGWEIAERIKNSYLNGRHIS